MSSRKPHEDPGERRVKGEERGRWTNDSLQETTQNFRE